VNLALEEALVEYDERKVEKDAIFKSITDLGFKVRDSVHLGEDEQILKMHIARKRMTISWIITGVVLVLMIPHMAFGGMIFGHKIDAWLMFVLSLGAMLFPARHVYVSAYRSVIGRAANMDVLIALGTISSLLVSPLSLVVKGISPHDFAGSRR
jgi:Cu+-exporting ATPase